jgi:hypothetical protein
MPTHADNVHIPTHAEQMEALYEAVDLAVDTDPLKLRYALNAVLARCDSIRTGMEDEPSLVGAAFSDQFKLDIARGLGTTL